MSEFAKKVEARLEGFRGPGLGANIWLGCLPIVPETGTSRSSHPACSGEGLGIPQEGSSSMMISSASRRQAGSTVEARRWPGFENLSLATPSTKPRDLNWIGASWIQARHQERTLLKINLTRQCWPLGLAHLCQKQGKKTSLPTGRRHHYCLPPPLLTLLPRSLPQPSHP